MANNTRKSAPKDPPVLLVMRRKSIRQFPNGQRVALYYIDKLGKYVSVPYDDKGNMSLTIEDYEEPSSITDDLRNIVSEGVSKRIVFEDGTSMLVDKFIANDVLWIYESLNDQNKSELEEMTNKSKNEFKKIIEFAKKYKK